MEHWKLNEQRNRFRLWNFVTMGCENYGWRWRTNFAGRGFCVGVGVTTHRGGDLDKMMVWFQARKMDQYVSFSIRFWFQRLVSKTFTAHIYNNQQNHSSKFITKKLSGQIAAAQHFTTIQNNLNTQDNWNITTWSVTWWLSEHDFAVLFSAQFRCNWS